LGLSAGGAGVLVGGIVGGLIGDLIESESVKEKAQESKSLEDIDFTSPT